jgi:hypothetical protein
MRTPGIVLFDPLSNGAASFGEAAEVVQPDALLFETSKEALDEAVLLGRIGRNELLAQPVIAAGSAKAPALEDEAVVEDLPMAMHLRVSGWLVGRHTLRAR